MSEEQLRRDNEELRRQLDEARHELERCRSTTAPTGAEPTEPSRAQVQRLLHAIFCGSRDAMVLLDDAGTYVDANEAACELFGVSRDALIGRSRTAFASVDVDPIKTWDDFLAAGRREVSSRVRREDGSTRDVEVMARANVLPGLHVAWMRDVTERRRLEARFQAMIEKSSDGISLLSADVRTLYQSPAVARLFGYSPDEARAIRWEEFVAEQDRPRLASALERLLSGPGSTINVEFWMRHRDGGLRWTELAATNLLHDPGVGAIVTNFRDATERKLADETKSRLAAIVEFTEDSILSLDLDGTIRTWNQGASRLYGYEASETIGRPFAMLLPPGGEARERAALARVARGEPVHHYETQRRRKDGTIVEVSLTMSPVRDGNGRIVGVSKIARDLTDRRLAEAKLRSAEEQLRQAQKMEAIGALAGGVAHDFNNLLSVILSYSTLLLEALPPGHPNRRPLEEIAAAGERAARLTQQLLAFGRKQILEPRVLDLNELVEAMTGMLTRLVGEQVDLWALKGAAGKIYADPGQVEQVLMNLVVNARDAMPKGGKLTIELADVELDDAYAASHHGVSPGRYVMLAVTDTGTGMDAATRERIFEPFFTTKGPRRGTGLGLSTVFGIVQQSRGHIWVYSELGVGTTFKVYFPATERLAPAYLSTSPPLGTMLEGHETILVVEDEDPIRRSIVSILEPRGYTVLQARNGAEALVVSEKHVGTIDLLLTDVIMPVMSGRELAQRLARTRPEARILYVSGYTEDAIVHHGVLDPGIAFLPKPITPLALLRKVREVLGSEHDEPGERPEPPTLEGMRVRPPSPPTAEALVEALPRELVERLASAALAADPQTLLELAEAEVEALAPDLAGEIRALASRFDYASLLELLGEEQPAPPPSDGA